MVREKSENFMTCREWWVCKIHVMLCHDRLGSGGQCRRSVYGWPTSTTWWPRSTWRSSSVATASWQRRSSTAVRATRWCSLTASSMHSVPSMRWRIGRSKTAVYRYDCQHCCLLIVTVHWISVGAPLFPLVNLLPHLFPFLLFPFFPWLYLFFFFCPSLPFLPE